LHTTQIGGAFLVFEDIDDTIVPDDMQIGRARGAAAPNDVPGPVLGALQSVTLKLPIVETHPSQAVDTTPQELSVQPGQERRRGIFDFGGIPGIVDPRPDNQQIGFVTAEPFGHALSELGRIHAGNSQIHDLKESRSQFIQDPLKMSGVGLVAFDTRAPGMRIADT
jgi:hypothetical protein